MKRIMIIEDEKTIRDHLVATANSIDGSVKVYEAEAAAVALEVAQKYDISAFFIDIQLTDYNGLELAKQLRKIKRYQFVPMVFITAMPTRELEAFKQIHCYDYLIKPYTQEQLEEVFKSIMMDYIESKEEDKLCLEFRGYNQLVPYKTIVYFEYARRKILIKTEDEEIEYYHVPLKRFKEQLPKYFLQIHQSYIVNKNHIEKIDFSNRTITMRSTENLLPIGRSYKKEVGEYIDDL